MGWDERQRLMLAELGIRVWSAPVVAEPEVAVTSPPVSSPEPGTPAVRRAPPTAPAHAPGPVEVPSPVLGSRPSGVESMDWPDLRAAVAGCTACTLCRGRRQAVFGVGHERAHWMIVGEAPGEHEDRQGEPFVGKAGQLLDRMLQAVGLTREAEPAAGEAARQVFIANVLKCRPPMNRNPQPEEVAQCEPYLKRQVALVQPRVILAMGRFAVASLLQSGEPIGRLRGRVHHYQGVPTIVTYHPAYLLRNPIDKARTWDDLCLARETLAALSPPV